jgi:ceramide glucosyltransferase
LDPTAGNHPESAVLLSLAPAGFAGLALLIQIWQYLAARQFPLHRREPNLRFHPGVSLLKPVKGADPGLRSCLESWLAQDYPGPLEVLFAVGSHEDPACSVIRQLLTDYPERDAKLVIVTERPGANAKVCKLAHLEQLARYDHWVASDADVLAPPDLLRQVLHPLSAPDVGLVTCFYRLANPVTAALRCEAVAVNADFWSQVLQSRSIQPQDFALGAVMAFRRSELHAIGGFRSLVDSLADDFLLGQRIQALGYRIVQSSIPVDCWDPPTGWKETWAHQLRWSRTIRVCRPLPFLASIVSNGTVWSLIWLVVAFFRREALWAPMALLAARPAFAHALYSRMCPPPSRRVAPWWAWIKDLQSVLLWVCAFLGNTVIWRGTRFRVAPDGRLTRLDS